METAIITLTDKTEFHVTPASVAFDRLTSANRELVELEVDGWGVVLLNTAQIVKVTRYQQ